MIWQQLNPALIFPETDAADSEDALRQLGSAVTREGYAKESYVQALLERERDYPTGLDVNGYGVAIPHTSVDHVNRPGIAIAVLNRPVTFIQMGTDDETVGVRILFMLAVVDPDKHIDELQRILEIIQDTGVLEALLAARDPETIINLIKEKEHSL